MRRLGLIGGMSWESTLTYYRRINEQVRDRCGGLVSADLLLRSVNFAEIVSMQQAGRWDDAGRCLAEIASELETAGAEAILICTNTMHILSEAVQAAVDIPLIHIVDVTAEAVRSEGHHRPLLLATRYTMEQAFYRDRMTERSGLAPLVPAGTDRTRVHDIIFDELCQGVIRDESRAAYRDVIARGRAAGADSVILGCTEIGLLIGPEDCDLPMFDSTLLHADAAVDFSLGTAAPN